LIIYDEVYLLKEPKNKFDKNAIKVDTIQGVIGYVPKSETNKIKQILKNNHKSYIESIFDDDGFVECNIIIYY
jgi:hypothetical protein